MKNLDFYILLIALPISSFSLLLFYLAFFGHPTYRFTFLQQSLVVFLFWELLNMRPPQLHDVVPSNLHNGVATIFNNVASSRFHSVASTHLQDAHLPRR